MTFELPYPPSLNNLYATVGRRRVLVKKARQYKQAAAAMAFAAGVRPIRQGDVRVTLAIYRPERRGDVDGKIKIVLDSLKGIAWTDDAQVKQIDAERFEDPKNPRAMVSVDPVPA